jgi:hypothetical protein
LSATLSIAVFTLTSWPGLALSTLSSPPPSLFRHIGGRPL